MEEKAKIFLDKALERVDAGEFDKKLNIPFTSKTLLKSLLNDMMENKLKTGSTPVISDSDINSAIEVVRETAAYTVVTFLKNGILKKDDGKLIVTDKWKEILKIQE